MDQKRQKAALERIMTTDSPTIFCEDASLVLNTSSQNLRLTCRNRPETLPFPSICIGKRVLIPRIPFLAALGLLPPQGADPAPMG